MSHYQGTPKQGSQAALLMKHREHAQAAVAARIEQMNKETERATSDIGLKFAARFDDVEDTMKPTTYGLVTLEQMKAHRDAIEAERERKAEGLGRTVSAEPAKKEKKPKPKITGSLSFAHEDEEEEEEDGSFSRKVKADGDADDGADDGAVKRKRFGKNPEVDTSFLPDREREAAEEAERERVRQEIKARIIPLFA